MRSEARAARRVGKNTIARLLAQVWAKLLALALVALVARYETADGLGRYVLVITVVGIAGALADLGLNIYLTREVARESAQPRQRELLGTVLPLKLGLSALVAAGLVAVAAFAPFPPATRQLIPLGGLLLLPEALTGSMRAFVNARQRMELSGLIDMVVRLVAVLASFPALVAGFGVAGVLVSTIGATLLGAVLYGLLLRRWRDTPRFRWSPAAWCACLTESYPFAVTSVVAILYARVDLVLLGLWQGELMAGWYAAAYKLWETVGLLPASLLEAMFPEMSRLSGTPDGRQGLRRLFRSVGPILGVIGLLLTAVGVLTAGALITLIYGTQGDYGPAVGAFQVLVCSIPAMFLYLLSGHMLYALDRQRRVTLAMLIVGLVNITANLIVIPRWSYLGAAWVALASEWLLLALLYPQARRALAGRNRART